jgi:hypothetical protein
MIVLVVCSWQPVVTPAAIAITAADASLTLADRFCLAQGYIV